MSAIMGCFSRNEPVTLDNINSTLEYLARYNWDRIHSWSDAHVFLSCHMQWITPESIHEILPFYDENRNLAITADAIIDNRSELFDKLLIRREDQINISDSQLILEAYVKWGEQAPKHLLGDYVFMIWDPNKDQLFGARDQSGSRTFYYIDDTVHFAFCSAIAPLFKLPYFNKELNERWLAEFLAIRGMYESYDIHATAYKSVRQIPAGHTIRVRRQGVELSQYSHLDDVAPLYLKSNEEYEEAFRTVLEQAVKARVRTFKEVGSALSGGLDSGSVASFASPLLKEQGKELHAYSYVPESGFEDWTSSRLIADETPYIRSTVNFVGNIRENYMNFAGKSPLTEVNDWLDILEMPYKFFENSFWIRGFYERAQAQGVGVLLTGAKGNFTISWGPALDYYAQLLRRGKLFHLAKEVQQYSIRSEVPRARLLPLIGRKAFPVFQKQRSVSGNPVGIPELINPDFANKMRIHEQADANKIKTDPRFMDAITDRKERLSNLSIANKNGAMATKLSMRYGLVERDPTNDPRVVRFCLSVPLEQYVQKGQDRALLRRSMMNYLPDKVRLNQSIRGVQPADWIHRNMPLWDSWLDELREICRDSSIAGFLNITQIKKGLEKLEHPRPELAWDLEVRMLMHSLIVYRFIKQF
ncbi:asparagine synthase-related protein [Neobacillus mesonae]|nr:asparagine synthase-related protein [Neobacillus mesonae]